MIQSACAITAKWCSMTMTKLVRVDEPVEQAEKLLGKVVAGLLRREPRIGAWSTDTTPSRPDSGPWISELFPDPAPSLCGDGRVG